MKKQTHFEVTQAAKSGAIYCFFKLYTLISTPKETNVFFLISKLPCWGEDELTSKKKKLFIE